MLGEGTKVPECNNHNCNSRGKHAGLAAALPGLHTFTGCDFTASFFHKGKVNPYEIFEKDTTGTFISFFQSWTLRDEPDQKISEAYVHSLYGMDEVKDIDEGRYKRLFE